MAVRPLARLAAGMPVPVFPAVGAGARDRVQDLRTLEDVELVSSPQHATVLLVAGSMLPASRSLSHGSMIRSRLPRVTVWWTDEPSPAAGHALPGAMVVPGSGDVAEVLTRVHRELAAALAISFLSLVGIPPLAGFTGKLTLFLAALDAGYGWLTALAIVNTPISLFYYLRVLGPAYFGDRAEAVPVLGRWAAVPALGAAAGVIVVVGLAGEPLLSRLAEALLMP